MPIGRLIGTSDLKEIADQGTGGERIYLKGQFVVNFSDANRAVLAAARQVDRFGSSFRCRADANHCRISGRLHTASARIDR